ncbi:MAG: adenylosuccinate lyase [Thermoplasmatota archaeon]
MDLVCPLDFRYGQKAMKALWTEEARLRYLLEVEVALAKAHAALGTIPPSAAKELEKAAKSGKVTPERVKEIEAEIKHDLMAVVQALGEASPKGAAKFIHLGATSYDIIDTATSLQFRDSIALLRAALRRLRDALLALAEKHRHTAMLGRTHGQAAVPVTFGLKMAVFASEVGRHLERLAEAEPRVLVGMVSGATGSMAALGEKGFAVQDEVCRILGLTGVTASTQIVQRDRHIELFSLFANVASSLEKFSTEVRNLQRTEIHEVAEAFDRKKQVGSSAMPNKQNPITSEQVSGLARLVRSMTIPVWENAVQWHERDLANSAPERFLNPHAFILLDHITIQLAKVFETLQVYPERMKENMERAQGLMMAESVVMALTKKGWPRHEAHEEARKASLQALDGNVHFRDALHKSPKILKALGKAGIAQAVDPNLYVGPVDEIIDRVVAETRSL